MKNHSHSWRGAFLPAIGVLAMLVLAPATPASAADEEMKGWILGLDLALTQPGGFDQEYAIERDPLATPVHGRRHLLDNDAKATTRIMAGYNFGLGLGSLEVSYWGFDNDDSRSDVVSGYVYPTVFGYGYYSSSSPYLASPYGVRTRAKSSIKATSLEVDYSRALDVGDNFTFRWLAGLRSVTFEEEVQFDGSTSVYIYGGYYGAYYATSEISQKRHMDSDAFGIKVGGRGTFGFTRRFSLEGGAALSLLTADIKGNSSQAVSYVDPLSPAASFSFTESNRAEGESGRGQILDLDLRGIWTEGPLSIYLGYSASSWEGLVRDPNPPRSHYFPFAAGRARDSVSFTSFDVGIIYRFGARRLAAP